MGTPIDPEAGNEVQGIDPDQIESPGLNPAWNDVLSVLPEQFHSVVTPHFQKWDSAANQRVEAANASLKDFENYKPFVEHGITQEELEQGLRLMFEVNNNPQNVWDALGKAYKFGQTPGTGTVEEVDEDDDTPIGVEDPRFSQLQQGLELVSQIVLNDAKAKQAAQEDNKLTQELDGLKSKYGEYDEDYVLTKMLNGASAEDAIKAYQQIIGSINKPFAPNVLGNSGSGSGLPSNAIDPTKLSGKETRNLVAQMLEAAKNN